jgi:hypothetical protein
MKQIIVQFKTWNLEFENSLKIGEFIHVKITKAIPFKLYGEIL